MESPVLGVGPGVLILALVWILAVAFGAMLWGSSWPSKLMVVPLCLAAVVVTVALASFPRSPETGSPFAELEIVDTFFIGRYVLLSVASAAFLAALFLLLPHHFLEPVYAKALRTR